MFLTLLILDIGTRIPYFNEYLKHTNFNILCIAYRGYSDSEGYPSEEGINMDSIV